MTGQASGDDEDRIDTDRVAGPGKARGKALGSGRDTAQTIFIKRYRRGIFAGALLDLDECDGAATACHEVDFAACDPGAPREDPPAVQPEPPRRD